MTIHRRLILALLLVYAAPLCAQQTRPATTPSTRPSRPEFLAERLAVTDHKLKSADTTLSYRATTGFMPLKEENGRPRANFYFVAYELTPDSAAKPADVTRPTGDPAPAATAAPNPKRPITFVFNGGPGAAAIWLHIGTAGPKVIGLDPEGYPGRPPYQLVDNPTSWLSFTDLVFIDPVGTGFSRPAEGIKGEEFYGVQQDIESVSEFIRLYLVRAGRWNSPKFLAGESYGTTRCAMLAEHLLDRYGIAINGVALISTVLNFQTISTSTANELPFALFLPSYTAAAHYHKRLPADLQADLSATLKKAERWATDVYTPSLFKGAAISEQQRGELLDQMSRFTGLSRDFLVKSNLRIRPGEFMQELLSRDRKVIGRFDARIIGDTFDPASTQADYDPSLSRYVGVYSECFNAYIRQDLKFESDLVYEFLSGKVHPWNWGRTGNGGWLYVGDNLKRAIVKNPHMKVLVASGIYDLATPYFATLYTLNHLDLSPALQKNIRQTWYEGGHMMYHHAASLEKLNTDLRDFYDWSLR